MKYSEFKREVEKLDLEVMNNQRYIDVAIDKTVFLEISKENEYTMNADFWGFQFLASEIKRELFRLATELASTPLDERENEPEFKVGDWVVDRDEERNVVGKITRIDNEDKLAWGYFSYLDKETNFDFWEIRHATPPEIAEEKERRWWNARDRKVWEVYEGDILMNNRNKSCFNVTDITLKECGVLDHDKLDEYYTVVCLAENREDAEE